MVYFALTTRGAREALAVARKGEDSIWLNDGVILTDELARFRASGFEVSCFTPPVDLRDREAVLDAIATIDEHHPNETIWVEALDDPGA